MEDLDKLKKEIVSAISLPQVSGYLEAVARRGEKSEELMLDDTDVLNKQVKNLLKIIRQRDKDLLKKVRQSIGKGNVLEGTGRRIVSVISTLNDLEELSNE